MTFIAEPKDYVQMRFMSMDNSPVLWRTQGNQLHGSGDANRCVHRTCRLVTVYERGRCDSARIIPSPFFLRRKILQRCFYPILQHCSKRRRIPLSLFQVTTNISTKQTIENQSFLCYSLVCESVNDKNNY